MSPAYLFVAASALAVVAISIVFKIFIEKLKQQPGQQAVLQRNFFIGVAIAEIVPIILVILGMLNSAPAQDINELLIPAMFIVLLMTFAPILILMQTKADVPKEAEAAIIVFRPIGSMLVSTIPLISLVGLFMMLPK